MGVDIPNIKHVIHWGCPASILQYWQEAGRASRNGEQAAAPATCTIFVCLDQTGKTRQ